MWIVVIIAMAAAESAPLPFDLGVPGSSDYPSSEALQHYAQGRLMEERGLYEQSLAHYLRAMTLDFGSAEIPRRAADVAARMGDQERALELAERSLRLEPEHPRGLWLKGTALFHLRRAGEALDVLERSARADSNQIDHLRSFARVAEQLDLIEKVAWAYSRIVVLTPDDGEAWFQLAAAHARGGRFKKARSALSPALQFNPSRPGLSFLEGWIEEGLGNLERATILYRAHLGDHPRDWSARRRLVNVLARQQQFEEAYREANQVASDQPKDPEALEVLTELAFRTGRNSEGNRRVAELMQAAVQDPRLAERVIVVLIRAERADEAIAYADAWDQPPLAIEGLMLSARSRIWAGRSEEAIPFVRQAVDSAPDSLSPRVLLARLLQSEKRFEEAIRAWQEVLKRRPGEVRAVLDLAYCREQLGDLAGAEAAVRDILKQSPEDPMVLNFLGYLLADHNRNLLEAENLITRAVNQEPENGAFVDSLGWVYYRLGRLEDARRELERALALTGGDPVVHEHLGDVYKDLQLLDLAKQQYEKSLSLDGSNERVRTKLEEIR